MKRKEPGSVDSESYRKPTVEQKLDWKTKNDEERIECVVEKRGARAREYAPKVFTSEEHDLLIGLFIWTLQKHGDYRQHGEPEKKLAVKTWRTERPSPETENAWRRVEQNTPEWAAIREGSSGASSLQSSMGWCGYVTMKDRYREAIGELSEPSRSVDEMMPCDLGHRDEDLCRQLSEVLLGAEIRPTGVWIHPEKCYAHASPDGLVRYPDVVALLNRFTANDSLRGLWENKISIYSALLNKLGKARWGHDHAIRPYHVIQIHGQTSCLSEKAEWTDYTSFWKFSERSPLVRLAHVPFASTEVKAVGLFKCGEMLISRCYANPELSKIIYEYLDRYIQCVQTRTPPVNLYHVNPKGVTVKWLPMIRCIWYLDGHPGTIEQPIYDPAPILEECGNDVTLRPKDWVGTFPPVKRVAIQTCYNQAPMYMTLQDFADMI